MYHQIMFVTFLFQSCFKFNDALSKPFKAGIIFPLARITLSPPWISVRRPRPAVFKPLPRRFSDAGAFPIVISGPGITLAATPSPGDQQQDRSGNRGTTEYRSRPGSLDIKALIHHVQQLRVG